MLHPTICPHCQTEQPLISAFDASDDFPVDGDLNMCFACGNFSIYVEDMIGHLRKPTYREREEIARDRNLRTLFRLWTLND